MAELCTLIFSWWYFIPFVLFMYLTFRETLSLWRGGLRKNTLFIPGHTKYNLWGQTISPAPMQAHVGNGGRNKSDGLATFAGIGGRIAAE